MKTGNGAREGDYYIKKNTQIVQQEEEPSERSEASSDKAASALTTSYFRWALQHLDG